MTEPDATAASAPRYVCRCEEIEEEEIRRAISAGASSVNDVKRRTRAGMGLCQGVYCVGPIAALLWEITGARPEDVVPMTARPPVRVIPLGLLAELDE